MLTNVNNRNPMSSRAIAAESMIAPSLRGIPHSVGSLAASHLPDQHQLLGMTEVFRHRMYFFKPIKKYTIVHNDSNPNQLYQFNLRFRNPDNNCYHFKNDIP